MAASGPWLGAALTANVTGCLAGALMARLDALVAPTSQRLRAGHSTAEALLGAGNGFALFVATMARLGGEQHAGRTSGVRVAIVLRRMLAGMGSRARALAERFLSAARHRRVDDLGSALAVELLEAAAVAGRTVAAMAGLVALMLSAAQGPVAG